METRLTVEEIEEILAKLSSDMENQEQKELSLDEAIEKARGGQTPTPKKSRLYGLNESLNKYLSDTIDEEPETTRKEREGFQPHVDLWGWYGTNENAGNPPAQMTYMPEYSGDDTCPSCGNLFDLEEEYLGSSSCPYCGQPFDIGLWIT